MSSGSHTQSPSKRRFDALSNQPSSPSARKRHRAVSSGEPSALGIPLLHELSNVPYYAFDNTEDINNLETDQVQTHLYVPQQEALPPASLQHQTDRLHQQTHQNRLALQEDMTSGKGTEEAYARHLKEYHAFWAEDQVRLCREDPSWVAMDAQPITVIKAAIFLEYETTRWKKTSDGRPIVGELVGLSSIKQAVNALESYRVNHCTMEPKYLADPQSQVPLRNDIRIRTYESSVQAKEPQRLAQAQELKALGAEEDTYTQEELIRVSSSCFDSQHKTKSQTHLAMRDRCMLLISTSTAFRGDNIRRLLLSDVFSRDVAMVEMGPSTKLMAMVLMSNQGKTNTTGRIDNQGAFRHRVVELCPIGATWINQMVVPSDTAHGMTFIYFPGPMAEPRK
ncbi:hypothetical protein FPV67DRAFT_576935 [Lyophyllum atratum]|nr:hypothetical protein FPV67DRAFT_576935 [Lyophyllum atratum]